MHLYFLVASDNADSELLEEWIRWLKNNIIPWSTVMEYWKNTFYVRKDFSDISQYFSDFPALKQGSGYILVCRRSIIFYYRFFCVSSCVFRFLTVTHL